MEDVDTTMKILQKSLISKYLNKILNLDQQCKNFDIEEIPRESLKTKKRDKIFYIEIPIEDIPDKMFKGSILKKNQNQIS